MFGDDNYDLTQLMNIKKQQDDLSELSNIIAAYPKTSTDTVKLINDYSTDVVAKVISTPYTATFAHSATNPNPI